MDSESDVDVDNIVPIEGSWTVRAADLARIDAILEGREPPKSKKKRLKKKKNVPESPSSSVRSSNSSTPRANRNRLDSVKLEREEDEQESDNQSLSSDVFPLPVDDEEEGEAGNIAGTRMDKRIDRVRLERVNRKRQAIIEKIEASEPLDHNDIKIHRIFHMAGNPNLNRRRMNLDDLQLSWQACLNKIDQEILDELGPDPGKSKCYGCTCSQSGEATDSENRLRILTNMWFDEWSYTNETELSKSLSEYANKKIIPFHRNTRKCELQSDYRYQNLTDLQIDALLFVEWTPASVYNHFTKHTPNPMAFWCKTVKRLLLQCDFLWENGAWMLDLAGENPKEQINIPLMKFYHQCCDKVFAMYRHKPEGWVMPNVHTLNILRNSGMLKKRPTVVENQSQFSVIV